MTTRKPVARAAVAPAPFVLVISDDAAQAERLTGLIEFLDAGPVRRASSGAWRQAVGDEPVGALMLADDLPAQTVKRLLIELRELQAETPVVLAVGRAATEAAGETGVESRIHGLSAPASLRELKQVFDATGLVQRYPPATGAAPDEKSELVGASPELQAIRELIERLGPTDSTVLLTGESGTGKEVIARRIHDSSQRTGPFVAINCGAIPDHLLESELFGYERGAFTGADRARIGRFESANGGTLFLDEIGDMPRTLQVKLLRVLQERCVERLGGNTSVAVDFRLIAATHRDLPQRIEEGLFREDLYYRLSVFPVEIPPLRDRKDDIQPLIDTLRDRVRRKHGVDVSFSDGALQLLLDYAWPGNVRELANLIERLAVIHSDRLIEADDLPWPITDKGMDLPDGDSAARSQLPEAGINLREYLSDIERRTIESALRESDGVVQAAADRLGVRRTTLVEKIKKFGISV